MASSVVFRLAEMVVSRRVVPDRTLPPRRLAPATSSQTTALPRPTPQSPCNVAVAATFALVVAALWFYIGRPLLFRSIIQARFKVVDGETLAVTPFVPVLGEFLEVSAAARAARRMSARGAAGHVVPVPPLAAGRQGQVPARRAAQACRPEHGREL